MSNKAKKINYTAPIIAILLIALIALVTYFVSFNMNITNYTFTFDKSDYEYTGSEITPDFITKTKAGLVVDLNNYNVEYENNEEVGEATVTLTHKKWLFSKAKAKGHFNIVPAQISNVNVTSSEAYPDGKYSVELEYNGMKLKSNEDYTVSFDKDKLKPASENIFVLTGIGKHYTGEQKIAVPTGPTPVEKTSNLSTTENQIGIEWNKEDNVSYEIYKTDKDGKNEELLSIVKENSYTFTELPPATTIYYVIKPFAWINDIKLYSNKTVVMSAHTEAPTTSIKFSKLDQKNNVLLLNWNNKNCDYYEIEYSDNKNFTNSKTLTVRKQNSTSINCENKEYFVRIRCVSLLDGNGKAIYGQWSNTQKVK